MDVAAELAPALRAVVEAAVMEAQRQAHVLVTAPAGPPGLPEAVAGDEALVSLWLQARAGLDVGQEVALLRRSGTTWHQIGAATGMTRQSAHERWSPTVRSILDRYGTGDLLHTAAPDPSER